MPDIGLKKRRGPLGFNLVKSKLKKCSIAGWDPLTAILNCGAMMTGSILFAMIPEPEIGS